MISLGDSLAHVLAFLNLADTTRFFKSLIQRKLLFKGLCYSQVFVADLDDVQFTV